MVRAEIVTAIIMTRHVIVHYKKKAKLVDLLKKFHYNLAQKIASNHPSAEKSIIY